MRPIDSSDLELITRHRESMFREMGRPEEDLQRMSAAFREWLKPRLATGTYSGWIVEHEGKPIAGLGLIILDWPPHTSHPDDCRRAYVLNVYVEPEHRGRGLATALMERAIEESKRLRIDHMVLHASEAGRHVYEKMGWKSAPEMFLNLKA